MYDECAFSDSHYIIHVGDDNRVVATYGKHISIDLGVGNKVSAICGEYIDVDLYECLNNLADITNPFEYYN